MKIEEIIEKIEKVFENEKIEYSEKVEDYGNGVVLTVTPDADMPTYYFSIGEKEINHREENDFVFYTSKGENVEFKINEYVRPRIKEDKE